VKKKPRSTCLSVQAIVVNSKEELTLRLLSSKIRPKSIIFNLVRLM